MLKIKLFFNISINIKKKNTNIRVTFFKNIKKLKFFFFKKIDKKMLEISLQKSNLKKNLITILKSPFHYKITKLNISENFKKFFIIFYFNEIYFNNKYLILTKNDFGNVFRIFNYLELNKVKIKFKTIF